MKRQMFGLVVAVAAIALAADAGAQGRGRGGFGGGRGGGGGGVQRGALLRLESVQQELGLEEVQIDDILAMQREMRQQRGDRPIFRDMSDEERQAAFAEMREQAAARQAQETEKMAEILDADQMQRLNEIFLQTAGVAALQDATIGEKLGITADQKDEMQQVATDSFAQMREAFQSGDRDSMQEQMQEIRKQVEADTLAVLTPEQTAQYNEMKGKPFELSEDDQAALRGRGFGGRGGGGPGGPGGGGGRRGRPQTE